MSAKKQKEKADTDKPRREYVRTHGRCGYDSSLFSTQCHEMAGGSDRKKAAYEPATWLAVSALGHRRVQHEPKAKQLARKLLQSPETFDLAAFNRCYTGQEGAITLADVVEYLQLTEG
jgi:hypothetical protein